MYCIPETNEKQNVILGKGKNKPVACDQSHCFLSKEDND